MTDSQTPEGSAKKGIGRGALLLAAAFIVLAIVLAGCAKPAYADCCPPTSDPANDACFRVKFICGEGNAPPKAACCSSASAEQTCIAQGGAVRTCTGASCCTAAEQRTCDDEKGTNVCTGAGAPCCSATDADCIKSKTCTYAERSACVREQCTAMIMGRASYKPKPMQTAKESVDEFPPPIDTSLAEGGGPEGLYKTSAIFKPLDERAFRELQLSRGSEYINTFRFGIGDGADPTWVYEDFADSRYYFPISDRFCRTNPLGTKDRFMNYLNFSIPEDIVGKKCYACILGSGGDSLKPTKLSCATMFSEIGLTDVCREGGHGAPYTEVCTGSWHGYGIPGYGGGRMTPCAEWLLESEFARAQADPESVDYESSCGTGKWPAFLNKSGGYLLTSVTNVGPGKGGSMTASYRTIDYSLYEMALREVYDAEISAGGYYDKENEWQPGAQFECADGTKCYSGYCDIFTYNRVACVNAADGKEVDCPCYRRESDFKTVCNLTTGSGTAGQAYTVAELMGDAGVSASFSGNPTKITLVKKCSIPPSDYTYAGGTITFKRFGKCTTPGDDTLNVKSYGWCSPCSMSTFAVQRITQWGGYCPVSCDARETRKLKGQKTKCEGCGDEAYASNPYMFGASRKGSSPDWPAFAPEITTLMQRTRELLKQHVIPVFLVDDPAPARCDRLSCFSRFLDLPGGVGDGPAILVVGEAGESTLTDAATFYRQRCSKCMVAVRADDSQMRQLETTKTGTTLDNMFGYGGADPSCAGIPTSVDLGVFPFDPDSNKRERCSVGKGSSAKLSASIDMMAQEFDVGKALSMYGLNCKDDGNLTVLVEHLVNRSRQLLYRYRKPSIIYPFHFGSAASSSVCSAQDRSRILAKIFDNQRDLTDAGVIGLIYDRYSTPGDVSTYKLDQLLDRDGKMGNDIFCSFQKESKKVMGFEERSFYQKKYAENCTCVEAGAIQVQRMGKSAVCAAGGTCNMPKEAVDSAYNNEVRWDEEWRTYYTFDKDPARGGERTDYICQDSCVQQSGPEGGCQQCSERSSSYSCNVTEDGVAKPELKVGTVPTWENVDKTPDVYSQYIASLPREITGVPTDRTITPPSWIKIPGARETGPCCFVDEEAKEAYNESDEVSYNYTFLKTTVEYNVNEMDVFPSDGYVFTDCGKEPKPNEFISLVREDRRSIECGKQ